MPKNLAITFNNLFNPYIEKHHDFTTVTDEDIVITVLIVLYFVDGLEKRGKERKQRMVKTKEGKRETQEGVRS